MTMRLSLNRLRVAMHLPVTRTIVVVCWLAGSITAMTTIGTPADGQLGGLPGGLASGARTWAICAPFASIGLLIRLTDREEGSIATEWVLAGITDRQRRTSAIVAATIGGAAQASSSIPAAAIAALSRSIWESSQLWPAAQQPSPWLILGAVSVAVYACTIVVGFAAITRSEAAAGQMFFGGIAVFVAGLFAFPPDAAMRPILHALPAAPVWSTLFGTGRSTLALPASPAIRLGIALLWLSIAVLAGRRRSRPSEIESRAPRTPAA